MTNHLVRLHFQLSRPFAQKPKRAHGTDVGYDIFSVEEGVLEPGEIRLISAGIRLDIPEGVDLQIRSRSGLALRGIVIAGGVSTIDPGFQGDIGAPLMNLSGRAFEYQIGDRIAQIVVSYHASIILHHASRFRQTERGKKGFGSTGGTSIQREEKK